MVMQACKLNLPRTHPSLEVSSLLYEPISCSLALMLSDSSFLLYPSLSLFPTPQSPPPSPTSIPPPSTSSCFLRIQTRSDPNPRILFLAVSPHSGGSSILLRAWILNKNRQVFYRIDVNFKRDRSRSNKLGAVLDLSHGFAVKMDGSVNVFAIYSFSACKIWVVSVKLDEEGDRVSVDLVKCAVIDCVKAIYCVRISLGSLLLGEEKGVRVFPLRQLVKGMVKKKMDGERKRVSKNLSGVLNGDGVKNLPNGPVGTINVDNEKMDACRNDLKNGFIHWNGEATRFEAVAKISSNDCEGSSEVERDSSKLRTVKLRQDSGALGSFYVAFVCQMVQSPTCVPVLSASPKAVSIHVLSQQRFLILDSVGDVHLLRLCNTFASEVTDHPLMPSKDSHMRRLDYTMKVQMLAVLPDVSIRTQTVWVSDGSHSVHMISAVDMNIPVNDNSDDIDSNEKLLQISATQAIFTSEPIRDVISFNANAILLLGQGSIFAYSIS